MARSWVECFNQIPLSGRYYHDAREGPGATEILFKINNPQQVTQDLSMHEETRKALNELRLADLKRLAADGFRALDHGQAIEISDKKQLSEMIARIGRKATEATRRGSQN